MNSFYWSEDKPSLADYKYVCLRYYNKTVDQYLVEHVGSSYLREEIRVNGVNSQPIQGSENDAKKIVLQRVIKARKQELEELLLVELELLNK